MHQKIFQNNKYSSSFSKYVADFVEDVRKIRVSKDQTGSEVYVIENKKTYILDSKGVWHNKAKDSESGDTIVCDCVEESTIWEDMPQV